MAPKAGETGRSALFGLRAGSGYPSSQAPASAPATGATPAVATPGQAQAAPAFTLIDSEGVPRSLADFRGKTVVIE